MDKAERLGTELGGLTQESTMAMGQQPPLRFTPLRERSDAAKEGKDPQSPSAKKILFKVEVELAISWLAS